MSDIDRIRAVLDKCADSTRHTNAAETYRAYEVAIDAISAIAYPDEVGNGVTWRIGTDGRVTPDPPPTNRQLFAGGDTHDIEVRQAGGDWEWVGERRNRYLAMEYANTYLGEVCEVRIVKREQ